MSDVKDMGGTLVDVLLTTSSSRTRSDPISLHFGSKSKEQAFTAVTKSKTVWMTNSSEARMAATNSCDFSLTMDTMAESSCKASISGSGSVSNWISASTNQVVRGFCRMLCSGLKGFAGNSFPMT